MLYLLDTNIVPDVVRHPQGKAVAEIARVGGNNVATSAIVAAEIRFGAKKRQSAALSAQLELVLGSMQVFAWDPAASHFYADIRCDLEKRGEPIGPNDLLIAAHALALDATLVTDNEREFSRINGLKIQNWLR